MSISLLAYSSLLLFGTKQPHVPGLTANLIATRLDEGSSLFRPETSTNCRLMTPPPTRALDIDGAQKILSDNMPGKICRVGFAIPMW